VTAVVAVTFPVVVLALAVVLLAGTLSRTGVACVDGARAAARAVAAGEAPAVAVARAHAVVGADASVHVGPGDTAGLFRVDVRVHPVAVAPAWARDGWRIPVTCSAHGWSEQQP
jgi:hypothetical protein